MSGWPVAPNETGGWPTAACAEIAALPLSGVFTAIAFTHGQLLCDFARLAKPTMGIRNSICYDRIWKNVHF